MERPTSVTVFGILNILFALLGFLGTCISGPMLMMASNQDPAGLAQNPALKVMVENPFLMMWTKASVVIGAVLAVVLLVAGVGLLMFKSWGRMLSVGYAMIQSLLTIVGAVISFMFWSAR